MNMAISLPATISARDIQRSYSKVFSEVNDSNEPVVVISNNKPQVAIISLKLLDELQRLLLSNKLLSKINKVRKINQNIDQDKALAEISEVVDEARQSLYEQS